MSVDAATTIVPHLPWIIGGALGSVKDRLINVERVVTDGGYGLGSEIDALRDRALENRMDEGNA